MLKHRKNRSATKGRVNKDPNIKKRFFIRAINSYDCESDFSSLSSSRY